MQQTQKGLQVVWCSGGMAGSTPEQQMLAATARALHTGVAWAHPMDRKKATAAEYPTNPQ